MNKTNGNKDSHVVARFLTRPWEFGQRQLHYYDFKTGELRQKSSRSLYAVRGLFDDDIEQFLDKRVEDLSAKALENIISGPASFDDFAQYRAIILLILLQSLRFGALKDGQDQLKKVLSYDEPGLNTFVLAVKSFFQIARLNLPNDSRLYVPESGTFVFLVTAGPQEFHWAFGLPIHPQSLLVLLPLAAKLKDAEKTVVDQQLMRWSVGSTKNCKRIVVHPDVVSENSKEKVIEHINASRRFVDEMIADVSRFNELVKKQRETIAALFGALAPPGEIE